MILAKIYDTTHTTHACAHTRARMHAHARMYTHTCTHIPTPTTHPSSTGVMQPVMAAGV